jgi:hypothetical protein
MDIAITVLWYCQDWANNRETHEREVQREVQYTHVYVP